MHKVLLIRVREGNLAWNVQQWLLGMPGAAQFLQVDAMDFDITDTETYPDLSQYDFVINTAGVTLNQPVGEMSWEDSTRLMNINLVGAAMLTSEYAKARNGENSVVVHVGSIGARKVMTNCSLYCASKAGLAQYVSCAGYEMRKKNMAVIGVHPANLVGTPMTQRVQTDLMENRGMSEEQVSGIYKDAILPSDVAFFIVSLYRFQHTGLMAMSGENYFLGNGDHR